MEGPRYQAKPREATSNVALPKELLPYVTAAKLSENARRYPEMQWEPTEQQQERLRRIHEVLKQLPLIHGSPHRIVAQGKHDLLPADQLPADHHGNSCESDRSLGLTQCVFFGWGLAEKSYGRYIVCVSADILDLDHVFVTPLDIGQIAIATDVPFSSYTEENRARVQERYFDRMVSGRDWQEIVARRVLKTVENGASFVSLHTAYSLGEAKHMGAVPKRYITGSFSSRDLRPHYRFLYEHGFAFDNIEYDRRMGRKGVDPTPEECGVDYEQASQFWKKTLGIT